MPDRLRVALGFAILRVAGTAWFNGIRTNIGRIVMQRLLLNSNGVTESNPPRAGRTNALFSLTVGAMAILAVATFLLFQGGPGEVKESKKLVMLCAAGIRVPVEKLVEEYEKEYGVHVELQFGGSNSLFNGLQLNEHSDADLFLAGDDFYTQKAVKAGLAKEQLPIAYMRPVIAVPKDSKLEITSIRDLIKDDIRVVMGNPDQAAVGKAVRGRLQKIGYGDDDKKNLWNVFEEHVTKNGVFKPTVTDIAMDIKIGTVDAGIIWDTTVAMPKYRNELRAINVPELSGDPNLVTVCVVAKSKRATSALRFARFMTSSDRGLPVFKKFGFEPIDGDQWVKTPKITFFCGAVNRRAIEEVVEEFALREGVDVDTSYDGCGILTGRMKVVDGQKTDQGFPDVFMACDRYYLESVQEWFAKGVDVSDAEIVIAVPKGSDKVKSLQDLIKPGIRVAIGEPDQCTIGVLTKNMLAKQGNLYEKLKAKQKLDGELVVEKSSSAHLLPDVVSGNVDAAIAYITDTIANQQDVDVIKIDSKDNLAIQPFSVANTSNHKHLAQRLFDRIADSKAEFEKAGFNFRLDKDEPAKDEPAKDSKTAAGR
jgi:molybdate transport system substrate-binding protein